MPSCILACDFPAASGAASTRLFSLGSAWAWGRGATQAMTSQDCDAPWAPPPFTERVGDPGSLRPDVTVWAGGFCVGPMGAAHRPPL